MDVGKYLGVEFHLLLIDELTSFTRYIYETLRTRVRLGELKVPSQFAHKFPLIICSGCLVGSGTSGCVKSSWMAVKGCESGACLRTEAAC